MEGKDVICEDETERDETEMRSRRRCVTNEGTKIHERRVSARSSDARSVVVGGKRQQSGGIEEGLGREGDEHAGASVSRCLSRCSFRA